MKLLFWLGLALFVAALAIWPGPTLGVVLFAMLACCALARKEES